MSEAPVGVVGAGTMGAGIAQAAAVAGRRVLLADAAPGAAERAVDAIRERVKSAVAKGRVTADPDTLLITATSIEGLADCDVVVEAITEDLAAKRELFAALESVVAPDTMLASNSSSLSPTAIAADLRHPERVVGLHFFNPVPAMKLVEVIAGLATSPAVADAACDLAAGWGKTVVRSTATPAFIVNRIARPYYAEAWRLVEERVSVPENIDAVLTGAGGFRMGPFALMDLVGHDVNEAVTRSVWTAFGCDSRYAPAAGQRALVEAGRFGRKTGHGVYSYDGGARPPAGRPASASPVVPGSVTEHGSSPLRPLLARAGVRVPGAGSGPDGRATGDRSGQIGWAAGDRDDTGAGLPGGLVELPSGALLAQCAGPTATALAAALERPVVVVDRALDYQSASAVAIAVSDGCPHSAAEEATGLLQSAGLDVYVMDDAPGLVVTRTVAMLVNLAADTLACHVASADDIDTAMRLGAGHPLGPLEWGGRWGVPTILSILDTLDNWYRDGHYRASPLLRRWSLSERTLPGQSLPRQPR